MIAYHHLHSNFWINWPLRVSKKRSVSFVSFPACAHLDEDPKDVSGGQEKGRLDIEIMLTLARGAVSLDGFGFGAAFFFVAAGTGSGLRFLDAAGALALVSADREEEKRPIRVRLIVRESPRTHGRKRTTHFFATEVCLTSSPSGTSSSSLESDIERAPVPRVQRTHQDILLCRNFEIPATTTSNNISS